MGLEDRVQRVIDVNDVDIYSEPVVLLEIIGKETGIVVGTATGFLIRVGSRTLLITNWHIVAGRHSWNHEELAFNGATPSHLNVFFRVTTRGTISNKPVKVPLFDNDVPQWIEHLERKLPIVQNNAKFAIDVAVLDVTAFEPNNAVGRMPWNGLTHFHLYPMEQICILGYPFGLFSGDIYPIWISGTVANDLAGIKGRKYFLIDSRSRSGNSGSLAIHRCSGAALRKPGGSSYPPGFMTYVIGIYSGRVFGKESDIGIVWHWEVIDELIRKMVPVQEQNWETT